ncbi:MAG: hypothetical protein HZB51_34375 [Chloroflexi bacterium]|nr:hypothetical protein [Chloroflexota bacterium]
MNVYTIKYRIVTETKFIIGKLTLRARSPKTVSGKARKHLLATHPSTARIVIGTPICAYEASAERV